MQQKPRNPFQKVGVRVVGPSEPELLNITQKLSEDYPQSLGEDSRKDRPNPFKKTSGPISLGIEHEAIISNPLAQIGLDYTKNKISEIVSENTGFFFKMFFHEKLRSYFDVDQKYVLQKLCFILFPFSYKESGNFEERKSGEYIRKTDLYLPVMAMASFSLFGSLKLVLNNKFTNPIILINLVTKFLSLTLFESFYLKFIFYLALNLSLSFTDSFAVCSYKYVSLIFYWLFASNLSFFTFLIWAFKLYTIISSCHFSVN